MIIFLTFESTWLKLIDMNLIAQLAAKLRPIVLTIIAGMPLSSTAEVADGVTLRRATLFSYTVVGTDDFRLMDGEDLIAAVAEAVAAKTPVEVPAPAATTDAATRPAVEKIKQDDIPRRVNAMFDLIKKTGEAIGFFAGTTKGSWVMTYRWANGPGRPEALRRLDGLRAAFQSQLVGYSVATHGITLQITPIAGSR